MKSKDKEDLKKEVDYIFESGANAIRIREMVESFIDRRYTDTVIERGHFTGRHICPKCGRTLSVPYTLELCPACDNETEDDGGL